MPFMKVTDMLCQDIHRTHSGTIPSPQPELALPMLNASALQSSPGQQPNHFCSAISCCSCDSVSSDANDVAPLLDTAAMASVSATSKMRIANAPAAEAFLNNSNHDLDVLVRLPYEDPTLEASPMLSQQDLTLPFNEVHTPVQINTPLFQGSMVLLLKNLPNTPRGRFDGRRRLMWCALQGRFKQQVPFETLMLGSEFDRPLQLPAATLLTAAATWLVQRMGSGVTLNAAGPQPFILAPLIAAAQVVNVALPGSQPSLLEAEEDMTLADSSLVGSTGGPLPGSRRRAFFGSKANMAGRSFDTHHVWTFHLYDQSMDYSTFRLAFPLFKLDLVQVLVGQPLQLMVKEVSSGDLMMKFEVWHKRMLQHKANMSAADKDGPGIADTATSAEILIKDARAKRQSGSGSKGL